MAATLIGVSAGPASAAGTNTSGRYYVMVLSSSPYVYIADNTSGHRFSRCVKVTPNKWSGTGLTVYNYDNITYTGRRNEDCTGANDYRNTTVPKTTWSNWWFNVG